MITSDSVVVDSQNQNSNTLLASFTLHSAKSLSFPPPPFWFIAWPVSPPFLCKLNSDASSVAITLKVTDVVELAIYLLSSSEKDNILPKAFVNVKALGSVPVAFHICSSIPEAAAVNTHASSPLSSIAPPVLKTI